MPDSADQPDAPRPQPEETAPATELAVRNVLVTGATGFVGQAVVCELLKRGMHPVCLVRSPEKFARQHPNLAADRFTLVSGDLEDERALAAAAEQSQAAIHLVGIILENSTAGQTFERVHVEGTRRVLAACRTTGVRRYVQMSAIGAREDGPAVYFRTKAAAEALVRDSGLDWTILRPSVIHGAKSEFMNLLRVLLCTWWTPAVPYFGKGDARLQPVAVEDVAYCFVESLFRPQAIGRMYELGGPRTYSWKELYNAARAHLPHAKRHKPMVSQPVPIATLIAGPLDSVLLLASKVVPTLGLLRFNRDQVAMAQEDNVCDHTLAERAFGISMRDFEEELAKYADHIT